MALTSRTIAQFRQSILDAFTVYRPGDSVEEGSDAWCIANAVAIQLYRDQQRDLEIGTWITPLNAVGAQLDAHGQRWLPPTAQRKGATKWGGQIRLTALAGLPAFGAGKIGTAGNGQSYITTEAVGAGHWTGPGGTADVNADAVVAGTAANQGDGTTLTLASPPAGVSPSATLIVNVNTTLGTDAESDTDWRSRVLGATVNRPGAGNAGQWIEWAESVPGVYKAFCYKRFYGLTTVVVVLLGPPGTRVSGITGAIITAVETKLAAEKPTGHTPTVLVLQPTYLAVVAAITPKTGYGPDWTGTLAEDPAQASTTTKVYTTTDPAASPNFLAHGMRVVCKTNAVLNATEERIVDVVGPGHYFTVTVPFSAAVNNSSTIYPGGPLWQPCYNAIAAVFDALGPARETTGNAPRVPDTAGSWPSKLFVSDLTAAIDNVAGVAGCTVTAPAADTEETCAQYAALIHILAFNPSVTLTFV
jgi:uncharacterized phage protein gp47/JayE